MTLHRVSGGGVTAVIEPQRGGKIVSLTGPDGREWLAQPRDSSRPPDRGNAVFVDCDPAGWDECAPSIDACLVGERPVPDHGDLWTAEWAEVAADAESLELSVIGRSLDYRLTRRITATRDGLRFEYEATTLGPAVPFLWAAHPQFVSPAGSSILLPAGVSMVVDVLDPGEPQLHWTEDLAAVESLPVGGCRKLYIEPATKAGSATLRHADGGALALSWHGCDYVGLWFDNCSYSREPVVAIEPSLGFRDSLAWAVEHGHAPILRPGETTRWSLDVAIGWAT
jgi:hypothetical protein